MLLIEAAWATGMAIWVLMVIYGTRLTYDRWIANGMEPMVAVYYNRKIVHMLAAGVVLLLMPLVFTQPWLPLIGGFALGSFTAYMHKFGGRMHWMQNPDNMNDSSFAFMLGISIFLLWILFDDPWLAVLPSLFMAFGDGVTGVVRNKLFSRRTKSAWGNVAMAIVSLPMGWFIGAASITGIPLWGLIAGAASSFVERYEFGPIDDNVLIVVTSTLILIIGANIGALITMM
tara:strand:- start:514 stop:1203 length:690 start_codon:yes stop_codon:yes gene_type:complete